MTHDKDFGNILNNPLNFNSVVFIRYSNQHPDNVIKKFSLDLKQIIDKFDKAVIVLYDKYIQIYE